MARKKSIFHNGSIDIMHQMTAAELLMKLQIAVAEQPDAIVTIRQLDGTDFPPFISIQTPEAHERDNEEGAYQNLLA